MADIIGYIGSFIGTTVMLPQIFRTIKTKKAEDLSYIMLGLYMFNCILWLTYGLMLKANPIIVCNSVALVIITTQIILKGKYGKYTRTA